MPELPEVETVRAQLKTRVIGKTIERVDVYHAKTVAHDDTIGVRLAGKEIADIGRIGKLLIISFKNEADLFLLVHLKMTGQLFFVGATGSLEAGGGHSVDVADTAALPGPHTRSVFFFTDGSALYFNDMRLFGYTKLASAADVEIARSGFGPEPIDPAFDCAWFSKSLRKRTATVKAALLDQSFVAGLGNIYVDEALWQARVRPTRRSNRVTKAEAAARCAAAAEVMNASIAVGGTTFQHFVDTNGNTGNFTEYLQVFGKQGTPCSRCGGAIKKTKVASRGTHYCPNCQR